MDMICLMHQGKPYGHLKVGSKVIDDMTLSRMVGCPLDKVQEMLEELEKSEVFSRKNDGTIYSRRMVKDDEIRRKRSKAGKLGGNPLLKQKVNHDDIQMVADEDEDSSICIKEKNKATLKNRFESFYTEYPRKKARQKASQAFMKIAPGEKLFEVMLRALRRQKKSIEWNKENGAFIPHPPSWLNGARWEDEPEVTQEGTWGQRP